MTVTDQDRAAGEFARAFPDCEPARVIVARHPIVQGRIGTVLTARGRRRPIDATWRDIGRWTITGAGIVGTGATLAEARRDFSRACSAVSDTLAHVEGMVGL